MVNYTTTKFSATETIGDSIFNKNMITEASINIIPNQGYVVAASDFSISTLPTGISAVAFTDTSVASQPGNQVKATATFASTFVVAKRNKIVLDFSGDAKTWDPEATTVVNVGVTFIDDKNDNKNGTSTITVESDYAINSATTVGTDSILDIVKNTITGTILRGTPTKIATLSITADDGYYFINKPYLNFYDNNFRNIKLRLSSTSRDSNNKVTGYIFSLIYNNSYNIDISNPLELSIVYSAIAIPTTVREIVDISCGSDITEGGAVKDIIIYGNEGAEFDITITKGSDKNQSILLNPSSNKNKNAPNKNIRTVNVKTPSGTVKGLYKKIIARGLRKKGALCYTKFSQEFPANNEIISTTTTDGAITDGTTITTAAGGCTNVKIGDRLFVDTIPTNTIVKVVALVGSIRVIVDTAVTYGDGVAAVFRRQESYDINIYPRAGTTLGSRIPLQVPHYTVNQYKNPVLKFTATTANGKVTAPASVTIAGGRPNTLASKIRESLTATAASGTTVVSYYKGGLERGRRDYFRVTYTVGVTHAITIDNQPVFSNLDSTASNWTNTVTADNGGTKIVIGSVVSSVVSSPDHVYTLSFDVLIKKFGTEDTTMVLDLDNLISA